MNTEKIKGIAKKAAIAVLLARGAFGFVGDLINSIGVFDEPLFNRAQVANVYGDDRPEIILEGKHGKNFIYSQNPEGQYIPVHRLISEKYETQSLNLREQQEKNAKALHESHPTLWQVDRLQAEYNLLFTKLCEQKENELEAKIQKLK